jgi:hypothetical protein
MLAASVEVAGSSPIGNSIPFFGNGSDIKTIEAIVMSIRIRNVTGATDNSKLVLPSSLRFHEYTSRGTESSSIERIMEYSFIGTPATDK